MTDLTKKAAAFAAKAHAGQKRKYTFEPYFTHVEAVAKAVAAAGGDEAMVAAAYLHDVLEDCPQVSYGELVREFGKDVATLVSELTHVFTPEAFPTLNRKERKALETARLAKASKRAKLIKVKDIEHNTPSIVAHDPKFAKVFLPEREALLKVLQ